MGERSDFFETPIGHLAKVGFNFKSPIELASG